MASYEIRWKRSAVKELKKIHKAQIGRILEAVSDLSHTPLPVGAKKLSGSEYTYRIRVGNYRIIYDMLESELFIEIIRVRHRKDAYL